MKQYCRYCIHCCTGNGNWCEAKKKSFSDAYFKRVNHCKLFEFCEIDAFAKNPNPYKPRDTYRKRTQKEEPMENYSLF